MSKRSIASHKKKSPRSKHGAPVPKETSVAESLTVFWSVTVLMCLMANVMALLAHFFVAANPGAEKIALLKGLTQFTGALVGAASLIVLPILYRVRCVPPPPGLAVFGACVAAAPILAVVAQALQ